MGGGDINVPEPTEEEQALQAEQVEILRQQRDIVEAQVEQQRLLTPLLFEAQGLTPEVDDEGNITGFTREEDPLADLRGDIERGFLERTQAALNGELPVDSGLLADLDQQETELRDRLFTQLGADFETSSPGIEALSEFSENRSQILDGARRGDLTLGEQLSLSRQGSQEQLLSSFLSRAGGTSDFFGSGANSLSQLGSSFGNTIGGLRQNRSLELQG